MAGAIAARMSARKAPERFRSRRGGVLATMGGHTAVVKRDDVHLKGFIGGADWSNLQATHRACAPLRGPDHSTSGSRPGRRGRARPSRYDTRDAPAPCVETDGVAAAAQRDTFGANGPSP